MLPLVLLALLAAPSLGARLPFIIGGEDVAVPGTYPWQGSMHFLGSHSCGCSLLSKTWVVTAAHCVMSSLFTKVYFGAHDIKTMEQGDPTEYSVAKAIKHPDFDMQGDGFPNDIALLKMKTEVNVASDYIGTISLAPSTVKDSDLSGCVITGWGATSMIGGIWPVLPNILQEADVNIFTKAECQKRFEDVGGATILDSHVCVGAEGRGGCSGDSGGPLVCKYNGEFTLVGLTSWGIRTCDPKYASVYTRISSFRDWLDKNMDEA